MNWNLQTFNLHFIHFLSENVQKKEKMYKKLWCVLLSVELFWQMGAYLIT